VAKYEVFATEEAEADLDEIVEYIEFHDSAERADYLYEKLKQTILKLEILPGRGRIVPELREIGVMEYREILYKPYRILYFISGKRVIVHGVFDGRRGIEELLSRRLLR
jgi:toxin ParE1/3/4